MGWFGTLAKNADSAKGALKNLDDIEINSSVKAATKDAKVDVPLKGKDSGLEAPNTKPKDSGVEPPKTTAQTAKDLAKNVVVGGGLAGLGAFIPTLIDTGGKLAGGKILSDTAKDMFNALLNSPEGLAAVVAGVALVAYVSTRR